MVYKLVMHIGYIRLLENNKVKLHILKGRWETNVTCIVVILGIQHSWKPLTKQLTRT